MSVRANWHLDDLVLPPDVDAAAEIAELKSAPVIDLSTDLPALHSDALAQEFRVLVQREQNYADLFGQECAAKWTVPVEGGSMRNPCRSCPMFCHDQTDPDALLCNLGITQEGVLDAFLAAQRAERLDERMLRAVESRFDAAHELAEALL